MTLRQLMCSVLMGLVATTACNRNQADTNSQRTAEQVKTAATKAGHQLADSWLTTKIQAQYFADDDIKARHINVSTRDGVVTLTGFVEGEPQRELALQIAKTTDGVKQVNDRLTLARPRQEQGATATTGTARTGSATTPAGEPDTGTIANSPPPSAPDDAQLTARVQSKFFVDDRVRGRQIDVSTTNGVVALSGQVADESERAQALLVARTTQGVTRVEDHLTVAPIATPPAAEGQPPRADDATLTTTIQAKYFVDSSVKSSAIDVSVKDGVVLLEGSVGNDAARKQALAIAQNTEGVVQVIDRLTVAPAAR